MAASSYEAKMSYNHLPPFSVSLFLSAAYGILISFAALCSFELIGKQLGIGDHRKRSDVSLGARWFYTILFFVGINVAVYLPQALGLGNVTAYAVSACLSFFPLYFLFVRRWRRRGWVTPWAVERKKLRKDLPLYFLAFGILLVSFILTFLHRHPL
jgi:hypothetical protein